MRRRQQTCHHHRSKYDVAPVFPSSGCCTCTRHALCALPSIFQHSLGCAAYFLFFFFIFYLKLPACVAPKVKVPPVMSSKSNSKAQACLSSKRSKTCRKKICEASYIVSNFNAKRRNHSSQSNFELFSFFSKSTFYRTDGIHENS